MAFSEYMNFNIRYWWLVVQATFIFDNCFSFLQHRLWVDFKQKFGGHGRTTNYFVVPKLWNWIGMWVNLRLLELLLHKRGSTSKPTANQLLIQFLIRDSHKITKSLIHTKTAKWIKSYFINGASHKHFNYIFVNKRNYFFSKNGVRFEIWTFFWASFDLSYLGGQMENLKF